LGVGNVNQNLHRNSRPNRHATGSGMPNDFGPVINGTKTGGKAQVRSKQWTKRHGLATLQSQVTLTRDRGLWNWQRVDATSAGGKRRVMMRNEREQLTGESLRSTQFVATWWSRYPHRRSVAIHWYLSVVFAI